MRFLVGDITKWFDLTAPHIAHTIPSFKILISKTTEGKSRKFNIKRLKYIDTLNQITFRLQMTVCTAH